MSEKETVPQKPSSIKEGGDEKGYETSGSLESSSATLGFDEQRTKALLRKLDWNLVPFLALLYLYGFSADTPGFLN